MGQHHTFAKEQQLLTQRGTGEDLVDILVATPGRLVDHLTAGLSLQHLRFLVMDEADRLMTQAYQVLACISFVRVEMMLTMNCLHHRTGSRLPSARRKAQPRPRFFFYLLFSLSLFPLPPFVSID